MGVGDSGRYVRLTTMLNRDKIGYLKAGIDLPIVARPTLDSREVLTRIAQKETRRVMVFEREREKRRDIQI